MAPPSSTIIDVVIKEMRGVVESEENLHILNVKASEFRRMEEILDHNRKKFQDQHEKLPKAVGKCCLETLKDSVEEAKDLINRANRRRGFGFPCCCFGANPDLSAEKMEWKRKFDDIYQQLQSLSVVAAEIGAEESAPPPKLKSEQTDRQMAKSARSPEMKGDHTQRTAESTGRLEPKSDYTDRQMAKSAQIAESTRIPELKSDHSDRQMAKSARSPELRSEHSRQIGSPHGPQS